ncbi:hypothetical protein M902_0419 [Bacteriovorax sp. BAL6_X]|nr:hypothetical protein M902_0419 [Bacteriovorax sp. BAL6_X]
MEAFLFLGQILPINPPKRQKNVDILTPPLFYIPHKVLKFQN